MGKFRLADMDVRWSGVDDTTPPGHCLAVGLDPLGNTRVWLFAGNEPTDDGFRGSLLMPKDPAGSIAAYGPTGAYAFSSYDVQSELLKRLAEEA